MIKNINCIRSLDEYYSFHHIEHSLLSKYVLNKLSKKISFKMDLKKASIHLKLKDSFAIIGFRRSKKSIFIEFFSTVHIEDMTIMKEYKSKNELIVNRVLIESISDINDKLIDFLYSSSQISLKNDVSNLA